MREKLVFKKLKMTDHLCLQKAKKKVRNRHNQDEKLPFSLKVGNYRWRLVKYFKKVYVLHNLQVFRMADKQKHFPPLITILFSHAINTGGKIFHSPVNQHGHLVAQ